MTPSEQQFWNAVAGAEVAREIAERNRLGAEIMDETFDRAVEEAAFIADEAVAALRRHRKEHGASVGIMVPAVGVVVGEGS